ncbi:MAG TPA: universal stress protein [Mycobacteriales bacterium]|nr:universal stress protein [Mycobacteriales bacterium]
MGAYSTILVGTDGSESSFRAVDRAAAIAADSGATLVLVCAFRPMAERDRQKAADQLGDLAYKVAGSHPAEDILGDAEIRARKVGATSIAPVSAEGDPVDVIIEVAATHKADLVVVGNRGLNSLAGRLLGSVPQNVSHRSSVDVLIVHTTGK